MNFKELLASTFIPTECVEQVKETFEKFNSNPQQLPQHFFENPILHQHDFEYQNHQLIKRIIFGYQYIKNSYPQIPILQQNQHVLIDNVTFYLNWNAFLSTIEMLGTQDQVNFWSKQIYDMRIIGGYGQTEIGHGSDVQELQTTAIFNEEDDTFILNSIKASSYKLWPGLLGAYSTHMVIQAQTFIKNQKLGIQTFVVPIRDQNFKSLQGVDCGDIGMKLGFVRADNGYLGLNNYKVPRYNLLQRYIEIKRDGSYIIGSKDAIKFGYGSMLNLRVNLVNAFAYTALVSNVIASKNIGQNASRQQNFRMIRSISVGFAFIFANRQTSEIFNQYRKQLELNHPDVSKTLTLVHIYSSMFKSICGWESIRAVRESIQISPFGQLSALNLIIQYADNIPYATYEGDNNVLLQQAAKFLMKQFQNLSKNKPASGAAEFFNKYTQNNDDAFLILNSSQLTLDIIQTSLERLAYEVAKDTLLQFFNNIMNDGHSLIKTWNELQQTSLIQMTKIFAYTNVFKLAKQELQNLQIINEQTMIFCKKLLTIFGAFMILENEVLLSSYKIMNFEQGLMYQCIDETVDNYSTFIEEASQFNTIKGQKFMDVRLDELDFNNFIKQQQIAKI